jgi:hypothetical protein
MIMKKDLIFAPIMLVIGVMLGLLKTTGMKAHIAISIVGVLVLLVYSALTKKQWKIPALEIVMRAFYGIALISGVAVIKVRDVAAIAIAHKVSAALFVVLLLVLFAHKLIVSKKA